LWRGWLLCASRATGKKKDDEEKKNRKKKAFFFLLCVSFGRRRARWALRNGTIRFATAIRFAAMMRNGDTPLLCVTHGKLFFVEKMIFFIFFLSLFPLLRVSFERRKACDRGDIIALL